MSDASPSIAGVRMVGYPDLLYAEASEIQLKAGDQISIQTPTRMVPGYVVVTPDQLGGVQGLAVAGSIESRDGELIVTLTAEPAEPSASHIGAAIGRPTQTNKESSIHELYREYASPAPRLGSQIETVHGGGVIVALDRARSVIVVELETGATVEIGGSQQ